MIEEARITLGSRLQARRGEIERAATERVYGVGETVENADPDYVRGLRTAISTAIDYALLVIERKGGEEGSAPYPGPLLLQARRAARNGVQIETVMRRYVGGYTLFSDFLTQEARHAGIAADEAQRLTRRLGEQFDRLLAAIAAEYAREMRVRLDTLEMRQAEILQRLVDGETLDTTDFNYDFEGHHLGALVSGSGASEAIRELANVLDRRLLKLQRSDGIVWAWMGGRWALTPREIKDALAEMWPSSIALALGEPAVGLAGWRLTHRQARAVFPFARANGETPVRYADRALLASALQDDLLETSVRAIFLKPLEEERDGGATAKETLRAYFSAGRNASSAAALLGVSRRTVANRLHAIEDRLGRPLDAAGAEIEVALRLDALRTDGRGIHDFPKL